MFAGVLARRLAIESGECCYSTCKPAERLKAFVQKPLFPLGVNSVIGPNIEVLHPADFGVEQPFERLPKSLPDCPLQVASHQRGGNGWITVPTALQSFTPWKRLNAQFIPASPTTPASSPAA
jgi:hypothetical protein